MHNLQTVARVPSNSACVVADDWMFIDQENLWFSYFLLSDATVSVKMPPVH